MNHSLDSLSREDRIHMEGVLTRYGLQGAHITGGRLEVPRNTTVTLSHRTQDPGQHFLIHTNSLRQAKVWIGIPDAVFSGETAFCGRIPADSDVDLAALGTKSINDLTTHEGRTLQDAARAYVWGPSYRVEAFRPILETLFAPFSGTVHVYTTLDVKGTLTFDDDNGTIILANTINFYPGGKIEQTKANLQINATNIFQLQ